MVLQRLGLTLHIIGSILKYLSLIYVAPLALALYYGEDWRIFLYSLLLTLIVGLCLQFGFKGTREIERADAFTIVSFTWLIVPLLASISYTLLGWRFPNALFEAMSGFTGTGATILEVVEDVPKSVLLFRSLTQWVGGMGVIALFIAILPRLGVGGSQLFGRELSSAMPERLRPRVRITARNLWSIYAAFTAAEIGLLYFVAKLEIFDSVCVSLCTLATGGFTPTTLSVAAYTNPVAEYIIMFFMFLGGTNFAIHYHILRGNFRILKDEEFRLYVALLLGATLLLVVSQGLNSYRDGLFQAISIMTCTGFSTADFASWNFGGRMVLLALMFIGASGGSTGGAIKVVRIWTLMKHTRVMMRRAIFPNAVIPLKYDQKPLPEGIIRDIISFVFLYFLVAIVASIALSFLGLDLETSLSAVATSLANCGPGLGAVGPVQNYAWLPAAGKAILIICMWLGRLELFTVLMIFFPGFWKA
jgi:trk system potassium uptake protein